MTVTLVAPPGLGKSRLMDEAVHRLGERARVLLGHCLPYGESITYAPLIEAVHQLEATEGPEVLDRLMGNEPEGEQVVARVRATLSGAAHGSPDEAAWAFRRLFEAIADELPLVVIFDDIHWADPVLLDLIEYVGTFSAGKPILLLCAARPDLFETRPGWSAPRDNAQQLRIVPLTEAETADLLSRLGDDLDPAARRRIVETSGGVPLFVEQMAAFDAEVTGHAAVPPTIRALLAARVDRLSARERALLEAAAIQGATFRRDSLADLLPQDARTTLGGDLMSLIRREFIRPEPGAAGHDAYGFNHALIRDAVYDAMPKRARAELHQRYAELLEGRSDVVDDAIGYHLEQAFRELRALGEGNEATSDLARRAGAALAHAGREATARKEGSKAVDLTTRAVDLLAVDPAARVTVMPDLIDALVVTGDLDRADEVHAEAVEAARAVHDVTSELRAEMAWGMVQPHRDADTWQAAMQPNIERAIAHFGSLNDHEGLAQAYLLKGFAMAPRDLVDSIEAFREAHHHAQLTHDDRIQVETWDELGGSMLFGPTPFSDVLEFTRLEVEWARRRGIAFSVADGQLGQAYALAALGQFDEALTLIGELAEFFAQLPSAVPQHGEAYTLAGRIERDRGNFEAALANYSHAKQLFEISGHKRWWRSAVPGVAHAYLDMGRLEEARATLDEALANGSNELSSPGAFLLEAQARYLAATGDLRQGVEVARRAVAAVADTGGLLYEGRARETLAVLLLSAGDNEAGRQEFRHARDLYAAKGYLPGVARTETRLSQGAASNT